MPAIDLETAKYRLGHLAREFDSQTFVVSIEESHDGELYKVVFQRGYHSYVLEVEADRFSGWFAGDEDMAAMVEAVKLAVEELVS